MTVLVITDHSRLDQLGPSLDSVVRSSYRNIEILVISDPASRSAAAAVRSYARWDPRVKLVKIPAGLAATSSSVSPDGQYLLVLEAPDRLEKRALARLAKVLRLTESDFALGLDAEVDHADSVDMDSSPHGTDRLGLTLATGEAHPVPDRMSGTLFRSDFLADLGWTVEAAGTLDQQELMDRAYRSGRFDLVGRSVVWQPDGKTTQARPGLRATTITTTSADR